MWKKKHLFPGCSKPSLKYHFILDVSPSSSCRFYLLVENKKWGCVLKSMLHDVMNTGHYTELMNH